MGAHAVQAGRDAVVTVVAVQQRRLTPIAVDRRQGHWQLFPEGLYMHHRHRCITLRRLPHLELSGKACTFL